jgi:hypothetical protein
MRETEVRDKLDPPRSRDQIDRVKINLILQDKANV